MDVDGGTAANQLPGHPCNPVDSRPSSAPQADSHRRGEPSARESQAGRAFSSSLQGVSHSFRRDEPSARESQAGRAFSSRLQGVSDSFGRDEPSARESQARRTCSSSPQG
eukprot:4775283-Pyramimonas_sp.AAC.1